MRSLNSAFVCAIGVTVGFSLMHSISVAADFPTFQERTLNSEVGKVCYAVTLADVNSDGQQDIVAVTENRVLWFQNPTWQQHVMIEDQTPLDNVCIAAHDIDGDGHVDFALGAGWTKIGTLHWLQRDGDPTQKWKVHSIGEEVWLHRMRWADVLGTGRPQLVISPLNKSQGDGVRLTAFEIPADPVADRWPTTVLNGDLNRMHNHWHVDLDQNGSIDTLTASQEGVTLIRRDGDDWAALRLGTGTTSDNPQQSGAGEIKLGRLSNGVRFIATVEPMHGHSLVVYVEPKQPEGMWDRHVIDTGFQRGHALWTADLDGDGSDEIVFGHSDTPNTFGVIGYDCPGDDPTSWTKHVIDEGGVATEDLVVEDLTGDG
ncbi:MAG: VCBS repeat-containing protein, partial [Planctomycetaceae bacterium]|nr:VCBS repeat-containing protein [Planctomycetaceae bacterium]